MKAWQVTELGDPRDVLQLNDIAAPVPGAGEVLVRVDAVGLNFPDILLCQGRYQERPALPFTPGLEICGTVISGEGLAPGTRIYGNSPLPHGGCAEQVAMKTFTCLPVPPGMSDEVAASWFITYQTGYVALRTRADLQPGETLLVHAGAGGVGSAAIQLGKAMGATVIATGGGADKVKVCRELGADHAIDYTSEDFPSVVKELTGGRGADVIFDPVGGEVFTGSTKCVAFEGRILVIGFAGGDIAQAPTNHALVKNYSVVGVHWGLYSRVKPLVIAEAAHALSQLWADGLIAPLVSGVVSMSELPDALERLGSRQTVGKIVLTPQS